jgi:hypothetical protein
MPLRQFLTFPPLPFLAPNDVLSPFSTDRAGLHIPIAIIPTFANSEKLHTLTLTPPVSSPLFPHFPSALSSFPFPPRPLKATSPRKTPRSVPPPLLARAVLSDRLPSTQWEAYTLGQAPAATPESGADLTVAEQNALAVNLELVRGTSSRYLIQRWGDGTVCDKTGRGREIEIQVHTLSLAGRATDADPPRSSIVR